VTLDRHAAAAALGIDRLTPEQEAAVDAVERGDDVVVVLPTGAGKSAIYQVAGAGLDGPTIVVSPLIALQEDQLAHLEEADDVLGEAAALHSLLSDGRRREVLDGFAAGTLRYLFLAPEQLRSPEVVEALAAAEPGLLVVDESHCVVSWGNDFRPAFLAIGLARAALGDPQVLALTASAAPAVRAEIAERLAMESPTTVVAGVERPNVDIDVVHTADAADAEDRLVRAVAEMPGPGLVYVARRADADRLAEVLSTDERPALSYHSGLPKKRRAEVHERFLADEPSVVVATVAFGLGIDKPDVRWVAHADAPESIDAWYQELGRAGRDGQPSRAVLFHATGEAPARSYYGGTRAVSRTTVLKVLAALRGSELPAVEDAVADLDEVTGEAPATAPDVPEPPAAGWTVDRLAEVTGVGRGQAWQAVVELVGVGAATAEPDGAVAAVEPGPAVEDIALEVGARADRRRALQRSQGEMMRALLDGRGCLWRGIAGYLGEPLPGLCEHCNRCADGSATAWTPDGADAGDDLAPGTAVTHPDFGPGTIVDRTDDTLTVAFDEAGYKTLDPTIVTEESLLTPT
jgi:ATP-dependent DNA helicase RecQ